MVVSRLRREERDRAVALMRELRVGVGGIESPALHRAMCSSPEIRCLVAWDGEELAGIALVEVNRNWLRRRPLLVARMVAAKIRSRFAPNGPNSEPTGSTEEFQTNPPCRWTDPLPRVLFIGVHPGQRGRGVGKLLYSQMFEEIHSLGYGRLLARIALDNKPSLRLHRETGWQLYADEGVVFAVRELN